MITVEEPVEIYLKGAVIAMGCRNININVMESTVGKIRNYYR